MAAKRVAVGADAPAAIELFDRGGGRIAIYGVRAMIDRLGASAFPYVLGAKRLAVLDGKASVAEVDTLTARMQATTGRSRGRPRRP